MPGSGGLTSRQYFLKPEHIDKIVDTDQYRKDEERYSPRVSMPETEKNDDNLNISRYVSIAQAEPASSPVSARKAPAPLLPALVWPADQVTPT